MQKIYTNIFVASLIGILEAILILVIKIVTNSVGLFAVAYGIKAKKLVSQKTVSPNSKRKIETFPKGSWLWIFGNDYDGSMGDSGGDWKKGCDTEMFFGLLPVLRKYFPKIPVYKGTDDLAKWWWLAARNPVNNLRLVSVLSCAVANCTFKTFGAGLVDEKQIQSQGCQFVVAVDKTTKIPYTGLYWAFWWQSLPGIGKLSFVQNKVFRLRIGFKIKPQHEGTKEPAKGFTFSFMPFITR